jgi:transposase
VHITSGNTHDVKEAPALVAAAHGQTLIADKAYDAEDVIKAAHAKGMDVVIPPKSNRKSPREIDFFVYQERHLVECFFARLKQYRRVATRYDKNATNFLAFVLIASVRVWLV